MTVPIWQQATLPVTPLVIDGSTFQKLYWTQFWFLVKKSNLSENYFQIWDLGQEQLWFLTRCALYLHRWYIQFDTYEIVLQLAWYCTKSTCIYPKLKVETLEKLNYGTSKAARFALEISLVYPLKSSNLFNFREGRQRYATEWEPFHITLETTQKKLHTLLCF